MPVSTQSLAISVENLTVGFGEKSRYFRLSLDVRRGEVLGLVGMSGGGKSVLLRTIIGLIPKREGRITIMGTDADYAETATMHNIGGHCGVLFQQGALLLAHRPAKRAVPDARENLEISDALLDELATAKLEMVGLSPADGKKFPAELSGGMTKRAALARALALDPEIVFLDEPTSELDPISASDFDTLIATLQETLGLTVFMVTHDLDSLHTVCDRVAALADGKIVEVVPIVQLINSQHPWVKSYFHNNRAKSRSATGN